MTSLLSLLRAALLAGAMLALCPVRSTAQGTSLVPLGDPAYLDLDLLHDLGLINSMIVGQRPYSIREVLRLTRIARQHELAVINQLPRERELVGSALDRLEGRFEVEGAASHSAVSLLDEVSVVATSTDAQRRPLLGNLGAPTETTIDPLASGRLGAPAVRGQTLALEMAQRAEPTGWLAVNVRERVEVRAPRDIGLSHQSSELLLGGLRIRHGNLALSIGREQFSFAQRPGDGLFLASTAPALDQLSLSSDEPFRLPRFLRVLGPTRGTIILAEMGASAVRSHSRLLIYKLSVAPSSGLELGWTFENHFLGDGHRTAPAIDRFIDFVPLIDIFRKHNYGDTTRTLDVESDKAIGIDGRLTIPAFGGVIVSGEWLIDDFDARRLLALFTNDGSESLALTFPKVWSPSVSLELSAKHMGIFSYTHNTLTNGMTTHERLLGDELGPDAKAFGAVVNWHASARTHLSIDARTALYSDVTYSAHLDSAQINYIIGKDASRRNELRDRLLVRGILHVARGLDLFARVGGERVRNARYFGDRHVYRVEAGATLRPWPAP